MSKKPKAQTEPSKPAKPGKPYGHVYHFADLPTPRYSARIWDDGRDVWHAISETPDQAYAAMREAAVAMKVPVDLHKHGGGPVETVDGSLPF